MSTQEKDISIALYTLFYTPTAHAGSFVEEQRLKIAAQEEHINKLEDDIVELIRQKEEAEFILQSNIARKAKLETGLAAVEADLKIATESESSKQEVRDRSTKIIRGYVRDYNLEINKRKRRITEFTAELTKINPKKSAAEKTLEQSTEELKTLQADLKLAENIFARKTEILNSFQVATEKTQLILAKKTKTNQFLQTALEQAKKLAPKQLSPESAQELSANISDTACAQQKEVALAEKQAEEILAPKELPSESAQEPSKNVSDAACIQQNSTDLAQKLIETNARLGKLKKDVLQKKMAFFQLKHDSVSNANLVKEVHTRLQKVEMKLEQDQKRIDAALVALNQTPIHKMR